MRSVDHADTGEAPIGHHLLIEYHGCRPDALTGAVDVEALLRRAARAGGLTVVGSAIHEFPGGGVTGVLLLSESHFSIHTWPERGHATADLFTCGAVVPRRAHETLLAGFQAERAELLLVRRSDGREGSAELGLADRWTE